MPRRKPLTIDDLWQLERIGSISLAPDGTQAVVSVTQYSMEDNKATSSLWLLDVLGRRAPRRLTWCGDADGQPQWSPSGNLIAFIGKRDQQGHKDETAQVYVIAPDGGEARRVTSLATGAEAFRWFPDGRRLALVSWVYPDERGVRAQARRHKQFRERKETAYITSDAQYRYWDRNLPMGRVPHVYVVDVRVRAPAPRDLFEGTVYELPRATPDATTFDIAPDGRHIVFAYDPAPEKRFDNRFALVELALDTGRFSTIVEHAEWDLACPSYSPDGQQIALLAVHDARKHTMPAQLAMWTRSARSWEVVTADWDYDITGPLRWHGSGADILLRAEHQGRMRLWRFSRGDRHIEPLTEDGSVTAFDIAGDALITASDSLAHPTRVHVHSPAGAPRRLERFNDALLARIDLGRSDETWFKGAAASGRKADDVQMWLTYPPGFNPRRKYPLLHVIHGGPHAAAGDNWHYRWNSHVFAAAGYVVAAVNYHGSSGFGYAFLDSITHRWGELELTDIEAATERLLAEPWADPRRVFAAGGSYGGYMVAWMNGHVPAGRYAAYICHAGCYDWVAMYAEDVYTWFPKELGAAYWDDMQRVHAQSPHAFASAMTTPTLVLHGALDYRVPDQQGLAYYNTLKARSVDARLVWFPDENHWILKPCNSRLWHQEFLAWLAAHDPGAVRARPGSGRAARTKTPARSK